MLPAKEQEQFSVWSEPQARKNTIIFPMITSKLDDIEGLVERSGTGIKAEEMFGDELLPPGLPTWH